MVAPASDDASDDPIVVKLTGDIRARVAAAAQDQNRSADDIVIEACRRHLPALEADRLDDQYQRGYEQIPEDVSDVEGLLPHLPLPAEDWT